MSGTGDRALTAEEVEQFRKNVAEVLKKTPLGITMSVDVADFGNWEKRIMVRTKCEFKV
jgi:lipopolysaccharide/colanic/teichoic acid biosynthesis glycosyltransferase